MPNLAEQSPEKIEFAELSQENARILGRKVAQEIIEEITVEQGKPIDETVFRKDLMKALRNGPLQDLNEVEFALLKEVVTYVGDDSSYTLKRFEESIEARQEKINKDDGYELDQTAKRNINQLIVNSLVKLNIQLNDRLKVKEVAALIRLQTEELKAEIDELRNLVKILINRIS